MNNGVLEVDFAGLSASERVDAAVALQELRARVDAAEARLFATIDRAADGDDKRWVRDELTCALRLSTFAVEEKLAVGRILVDRLPATLDLLDSGAIPRGHAAFLVEQTMVLDEAVTAKVEARVLVRAAEQTPAEFRRSVRRAVKSVDPREAEERHADEMETRRVCKRPSTNGMTEIWALLPADGAEILWTSLTAEADKKIPGDERTADQRRADALVNLAAQVLDDPGLPVWSGRRPTVQVTVAASTLLGIDDEPGELDGHGPIPASMARAIASDPSGTWRRLLTDPEGKLLDCSRTYRPPAALADFVRARDRRCRFPGCPRTARRTDIDHIEAWAHGGTTTAENLECLCSRHHHLKHEAGWWVTGDPAGELTWTSPTGHTYVSLPIFYD